MRVAVLFDRLGPYHHARLRAAGDAMSVTAIEVTGKDATYDWAIVDGAQGFERVTLFSSGSSDAFPWDVLSNIMSSALDRTNPDVVAIPGWASKAALVALQWCLGRDIPTVVMSASTQFDAQRVWYRESLKKGIVGAFDAGLAGGRPHVDYLVNLGIRRDRVFVGYDVVDNAHFAAGTAAARTDAFAVRRELSLPDNYFLASNRFVDKKNLPGLIDAYACYAQRVPADPWHLVILGNGPLRGVLEQQITRLGLRDRVHLPGFKQYNELPAYYALARAFVHSSTSEQWGLVVNEAMAAGLPIILSNRCGCARDLLADGENGFLFDPYDTSALADCMIRMASASVDRKAFGRRSQARIANWGPDAFARGLKMAADAAIANTPKRRARFASRALIRALQMV